MGKTIIVQLVLFYTYSIRFLRNNNIPIIHQIKFTLYSIYIYVQRAYIVPRELQCCRKEEVLSIQTGLFDRLSLQPARVLSILVTTRHSPRIRHIPFYHPATATRLHTTLLSTDPRVSYTRIEDKLTLSSKVSCRKKSTTYIH